MPRDRSTRAIRCRPCRHKVQAEKGDPSPFKHPAVILAKIRDAIEPSLAAAGFKFDGRNKPRKPIYLYIFYSRGDELFQLSWDRRESDSFIGFMAELIQEPDDFVPIATTDLSDIATLPLQTVAAQIQSRIESFAESVNQFLDNLSAASSGEENSDH